MAVKRLVDLARRDVLAALDDQLLQAAGDEDIAGLVHASEIAGPEPAIGSQRLGSGLRIPEIAVHHVRSAHQNLALRAPGHLALIIVGDDDLVAEGDAGRAGPTLAGRQRIGQDRRGRLR